MRKGYIVPNSTAESSGMLKLLQRKNWEPSQSAAMNAHDKICSSDAQLIDSQLTRTLGNTMLCSISYKGLVEDAMGFMKKDRKLYFEAAYVSLQKMVEGGSVERIETPKGNEYALTRQGRSAYERHRKKIEVGSRRKDDTGEQFGAFMDSVD